MTGPMKSGSMPFLNVGAGQSGAMTTLQKELLDTYEQANRAWLTRVKAKARSRRTALSSRKQQ